MRCGKLGQRIGFSGQETASLQETFDFGRRGFDPCCADTVTGQDFTFRQSVSQILCAGFQAPAAEGAERYDLFAAEIVLFDQRGNRIGVGAEPDGVAEEDDVVARNSRKLVK